MRSLNYTPNTNLSRTTPSNTRSEKKLRGCCQQNHIVERDLPHALANCLWRMNHIDNNRNLQLTTHLKFGNICVSRECVFKSE